jgi:hypothetical protein
MAYSNINDNETSQGISRDQKIKTNIGVIAILFIPIYSIIYLSEVMNDFMEPPYFKDSRRD